MNKVLAVAACLAMLAPASGSAQRTVTPVEWPFYGGDQAGTKYSTVDQINRDTVSRLEIAWEWKPGEQVLPQFGTTPGAFQNTPIMIDNVLYLSTPYNRVVALDPKSGRELWSYDPKAYVAGQVPNGTGFVHRGVAVWRDGRTRALRILMNSRNRLLSAIYSSIGVFFCEETKINASETATTSCSSPGLVNR